MELYLKRGLKQYLWCMQEKTEVIEGGLTVFLGFTHETIINN